MDLPKWRVDRLRLFLGDNLLDCDVCFLTGGIAMLRCVFSEAPDPKRISEFVFTDDDLKRMERESVPLYTQDLVRRAKAPFFNEETGLWGIALNLKTMMQNDTIIALL